MKTEKSTWPRHVTVGNVTVTVYRQAHKTSRSGWTYVVAYRDENGVRQRPKHQTPEAAMEEARLKAEQLDAGRVGVASMTVGDREELAAMRSLSGSTPPLAALREWVAARDLTGGQVIAAAKAWRSRNATGVRRIKADDCVERFIAAMAATGTQAERVYRSKLSPIITHFPGRYLDAITTSEWTEYLSRWPDGVSRNDFRKRAITMCRWARNEGHLSRGLELEIVATRRAKEKDPEIGILPAEAFGRLLAYLEKKHPHHLAALVLAGFCGIRSDEIQGKRADRQKRQLWSDVFLDPAVFGRGLQKPFVQVSVAKTNTSAWRHVPLGAAAVEWLGLCPTPREGNLCAAGAMGRIRDIGISAGLALPDNCFRHSYITYQVALTGDKPQVATWAGTSVARIDKHYRRPVPEASALAWFAMTPAVARALPPLRVNEEDPIG